MSLYVRADLFDFGILNSSTKWNPTMVSSLIEELKHMCGDSRVTKPVWLDATSGKIPVPEALCHWSIFTSTVQNIFGEFKEYLDVDVIGILLFCQGYVHARARAESFHRSEALAQSLATTAIAPVTPAVTNGTMRPGVRAALPHIQKLFRDGSSIVQYIVEHANLLIGLMTRDLVGDAESLLSMEQFRRLDLLFYSSHRISAGMHLFGSEDEIRRSDIVLRFASLVAWDEEAFPPLDTTGTPQHAVIPTTESVSRPAIHIANQHRATVLRSNNPCATPGNVFVVNSSESSVFLEEVHENLLIFGCSDCEIVILALRGSVSINFSDRITVRCVANSVRLDNSTDCQIFCHSDKPPVLSGDTRGIELGPFNVIHSKHSTILQEVGLTYSTDSATALWSQPICSTLSDGPYLLLAPQKFHLVRFPETHRTLSTKLAIALPQIYADALRNRLISFEELKSEIAGISDAGNVAKVNSIISGHFREWLSSSNRTKSIVDIVRISSLIKESSD